MFFSKVPNISLLCGYKVTKNPGRISHLMQPVVKRYNASDDDKHPRSWFPKGIRGASPRAIIVLLQRLLQVGYACPDPKLQKEVLLQ
jgi:hypothetical protein